MSESLEGARVAATRQNSGSVLYGSARPAGGENAPADTGCAIVIFACVSEIDIRLSHDAPYAGAASIQAIAVQAVAAVFTGTSFGRCRPAEARGLASEMARCQTIALIFSSAVGKSLP